MPNYNKVILMGNVTRDLQLKYLPNGNTAVVDFGLAVNRKYTTGGGEKKEDVLFVDCSAFGKQAETLNQYVTKGKPLMIEGRLRMDSWEDKSGGKRTKISVVVENFQFIGGREDEVEREPAPRSVGDGFRQRQAAKPTPVAPFGDERHFSEEDIPFASPSR